MNDRSKFMLGNKTITFLQCYFLFCFVVQVHFSLYVTKKMESNPSLILCIIRSAHNGIMRNLSITKANV